MAAKRADFAHYPKLTYATIQDGLLRVAQEKDLGKNGLKVLICFCRCVYADGKLGIMRSEAMQRVSSMTRIQVMHGMEELSVDVNKILCKWGCDGNPGPKTEPGGTRKCTAKSKEEKRSRRS